MKIGTTGKDADNQPRADLPTGVTTWLHFSQWGRNINRLSIGYAFQPRLRPA